MKSITFFFSLGEEVKAFGVLVWVFGGGFFSCLFFTNDSEVGKILHFASLCLILRR